MDALRHRTDLRRLLGTAVAAAFLLAPSTASALAQPASASDSFVDSIGVNTHTLFTDTPYSSRFDEVKRRLTDLGVRHIREDLGSERPDQYAHLNELAAVGIKSTLILGDPNGGDARLDDLVATVRDRLPGAVDAVEGPNEFSTRGGAGWRQALVDYQRKLYDAVKGEPGLSSLPVIGPSIVHGDQAALGDVSGSLDFGNMHSYPNAEAPEANLDSQLNTAALNSGSKPVFATETGYNTATGSSGELRPVSDGAMGTYLPRLFLEYFHRGVARTYSYELLDEFADPSKSEPESNFGLLRNDLSEKPAFGALRNLIGILADPGPGFDAESLDFDVSGDRTNLRQVLLQKRDGSFYIALWRADTVWDPTRRTDIPVRATPVNVQLNREVDSAQRYMPNSSSLPLSDVPSAGGRLSVDVGAQVVILRLQLGGPAATTGRIRFWVSRRSVPAGARVAVGGRLPHSAAGERSAVNIQRWVPRARRWRTVGHGRSSRRGIFRKAIKLSPARFDRVSRLRVVARRTRPSKPLRVRIRRRGSKPSVAAIGTGIVVAPKPSPGA